MQRSNQPFPTAPTRPDTGRVLKGADCAKQLPPNVSAAFENGIDIIGFRRLLDTAGPTTAKELLARLLNDLMSICQNLRDGFATHDWAVLNRQSHILIGLAGIAGAKELLRCAQALNAAAGAKDLWGTDAVQAPLMSHLTDLIQFVTHYPQPLAKRP